MRKLPPGEKERRRKEAYEANAEAIREKAKRRYAANPEYHAQYRERRRQLAAQGGVLKNDRGFSDTLALIRSIRDPAAVREIVRLMANTYVKMEGDQNARRRTRHADAHPPQLKGDAALAWIAQQIHLSSGFVASIAYARWLVEWREAEYALRLGAEKGRKRNRKAATKASREAAVLARREERAKAKAAETERICKACRLPKPIAEFMRGTQKRRTCVQCEAAKSKTRYWADPEKARAHARAWAAANQDKAREQCRQYGRRNRDKINARRERRMAANPEERIAKSLRDRMNGLIRDSRALKLQSSLDLFGCSVEHLRTHLESHFQPGMTWESYGYRGWHIDHIKPCASFDLTDPDQQRACFHWTNLQPLWRFDNQSKGCRVSESSRSPLAPPATAHGQPTPARSSDPVQASSDSDTPSASAGSPDR